MSADEPATPFNLSPEDQAMLSEHAETVQSAAKAKFSLRERLSGIKQATAKIVLFTDPVVAQAYATKNQYMKALAEIIAETEDLDVRAELQREYDEEEPKLDALHEEFMGSAIAVHMRAVPQAVVDRAQRTARKAYALNDGTIPEESRERFYEHQNHEILGHVIVRIVDATGTDAAIDRTTVADDLREFLPVPQYQRLIAAFSQLVFNDALASQATEDPGF